MASKILKIFLRLFIFTGMMSSISSKSFNYQQTQANPGFQSSDHQVLFQKIGFYAATVQYQHVVIPIPLWETIQELIHISDNLEKQQLQISKSKDPYAKDKIYLIDTARKRIAKVVDNINDIIESLPEDQRLTKRMIGEIFGSVGTLMGMFNSWEINRIAKGVGENSRKINTIIDISDINSEHLQNLRLSVDKITDIIAAMLKYSSAQLITEIDRTLEMGHEAQTRITNLVQQAQNKRLSVDLLTPKTLKQVFDHLQSQAEQSKLELLISKPSDLFQIETSYLHTNKTLTLILHVPMVAEENKLNLLQFIPFPLSQSLGANTTVTPKVDQDLIAVGKDHQYKLLGHTDLASCTKLGLNFLCEGRSVLKTDIEDSCLGALYLHNLQGVLKHCQFQLEETKETVFQTGPTQWLVSAPQQFASVLQCEKSHETIIINPVSTINVNPGCKLQLKAHLIQPDTNQRSQFQIRHHAWNWDIQNLFPTSNLSLIANELITLREQGQKFVTAQNLRGIKFSEQEIAQWYSPNYIAILCIIIAIAFFLYLAYQAYRYFKNRTTKLADSALDKTLNHLNKRERQEAIELKEVVKMYEQDEQRNHPNIIKIGDKRPKNLNMGDYTVITPTRPITPSIYPEINEHPTQY